MDKPKINTQLFGERLAVAMESAGENTYTLGDMLSLSPATISRYANGKMTPKITTLYAIAERLSVNPVWLMGGNVGQHDTYKEALISNIFPIETRKIPLIGTIAAGIPVFAEENFEYYVEVGAEIKADFALRVQGDSMINARINDGDIVFIHKQETVNQGEIAAVLIDDEATLKRFKRYGNHIVLQAENPDFPDIEFEMSEDINVRILGKAVAFQSDIK